MRIDPADHGSMVAALNGPRRQGRPWLRLLNAVLALAGEQATLLSHREAPWASVTFSGTSHRVMLDFAGDSGAAAAERFVDALPDHEFDLAHKLVADATVLMVRQVMVPERRVTVEAELLLLDEA